MLWKKVGTYCQPFPGVWCVLQACFAVLLLRPETRTAAVSCFFWSGLALLVYVACGGIRGLHSRTLTDIGRKGKTLIALVAAAVILACTLPMNLSPIWNGEIPEHRNQYEEMAESLLKGQLHLDHEPDPALLAMANPYDTELRDALGVRVEWDHAFYNGKYFMYFGVVPVLVLFLPYRLITGTALITYHATQVFTAAFIFGFFLVMYQIARRFFEKMSLAMYLLLASALSVMSVWFAVGTPAMYCTAITSAMCMMVWSLYFFIKAVWELRNENRQLAAAAVGAAFGALAFGCRPSIALSNVLVLPLLFTFLKQRPCTWRLIGKLLLAALPYAVVAALLMAYNAARFGNPLEFGQAYQLTVADQSSYGHVYDWGELLKRVLTENKQFFLQPMKLSPAFPYVQYAGILMCFPMLFLCLAFAVRPVRRLGREKQLNGLALALLAAAVVICIMDVLWSPTMIERYKMDVYFLLGLFCFLAIGLLQDVLQTPRQRIAFSRIVSLLSLLTLLTCFLLFLVPYDRNPAGELPGFVARIQRLIFFGRGG